MPLFHHPSGSPGLPSPPSLPPSPSLPARRALQQHGGSPARPVTVARVPFNLHGVVLGVMNKDCYTDTLCLTGFSTLLLNATVHYNGVS